MFQRSPSRPKRPLLIVVLASIALLVGTLTVTTSTASAATCNTLNRADTQAMQQKLWDAGFWPGSIDGQYGKVTQQAVYAFQKYTGMGTSACAGAQTFAAVMGFQGRAQKPAQALDMAANIDQTRQLLFFTAGGNVLWVFNTSTGSQKPWNNGKYKGDAITPNGKFRTLRALDENHESTLELGTMYRPRYFTGNGVAVHGSGFIPPYADSHGCVRVSNAAMDFIWTQNYLPLGGIVKVFGTPPAR